MAGTTGAKTLLEELVKKARPSGRSTIRGAQRKYKSGIYKTPEELLDEVAPRVPPEDPALYNLFGVHRSDLSETALNRQAGEAILPGASKNPRGTTYAEKIMQPANTQRLVDSLAYTMNTDKGRPLTEGMTGWYVMDPAYNRLVELYGPDEGLRLFEKFNTLTGIHSANSDVVTELTRGSALNYLDNLGRADEYYKHAGNATDPHPKRPPEIPTVPGHYAHKTAHSVPSKKFLESGQLQMDTPKVPSYIQASSVPEAKLPLQTKTPVSDAHNVRAIGLSDVRTSKAKDPGSSITMTELQQIQPWWQDKVAGAVDLESVPAQAMTWGIYAPQTGVMTEVGVPKLELLAKQIMKTAKRLKISPQDARDLVLSGKEYAGALAGMGISGMLTLDAMLKEEELD